MKKVLRIFCDFRARSVHLVALLGLSLTVNSQALAVTVDQLHDYTSARQWQLSLAVGHGQMQSALSDGGDIDLGVLPSVKYYGERFYLENTSVGYSLYESPVFAVDLAGRLNTDGLFFPRSGNTFIDGFALRGSLFGPDDNPLAVLEPPKRRLSYLGGIAMHWLGPLDVTMAAYRDVTGVHGGDEVPLTVGKRFSLGRLEVGLELGSTYQSGALVDYYYGTSIFSKDPQPLVLYQPGSSLKTHARIDGRYRLTDTLSLVMSGRLDRLDKEIWQSPFVSHREPRSFFLGLQYVLW